MDSEAHQLYSLNEGREGKALIALTHEVCPGTVVLESRKGKTVWASATELRGIAIHEVSLAHAKSIWLDYDEVKNLDALITTVLL